jgi:hypothetical protein
MSQRRESKFHLKHSFCRPGVGASLSPPPASRYAPGHGPQEHGHGRQGNFIHKVLCVLIHKETLKTSCRVFKSSSKYRRNVRRLLYNSAQTKALRRAVPNVTSNLTFLVVYSTAHSTAPTVQWW